MKKRRMKKLNNKGYSLVELIIVIAIIVVFSAAALITMSVMHNAKAKEAAITFDSEISELIHNSKNRACDPDGDGIISENPDGDDSTNDSEKLYSFGIRLHSDGDKCYLQNVLVKNGVYESNSTYEAANNPNGGKGTSLSAYVYVEYTNLSGDKTVIGDGSSDEVIISYKRDGSCSVGAGHYDFMRTNSDTMVATMTLNKNGSHQSN